MFGILALGAGALALAALVAGAYLLLFIHYVQGGGEWDSFVRRAHLLGAASLLVGAGLSWGAFALGRAALR